MLDEPLREFLKSVRDAFFEGDYETLVRFCAMPLVVYSSAGVVTLKNPEALAGLADKYRRMLSSFPISHGACRIVQHDPPVNQRLRVTVRWDEFDEDNTPLTGSLVRYFLIETESNAWKIEMLEYLEMPVSIDDAKRILH